MDKPENSKTDSEKKPEDNLEEIEEWLELSNKINSSLEREINDSTLFKDLGIDVEKNKEIKEAFTDFLDVLKQCNEIHKKESEKLKNNIKDN